MTDDMLQQVGSLLAGRYRITAPLARGGMGAVFEGVDENTGVPVAIKLVRKELAQNQEAMVRFRREIDATERIDAPQIVVIYHADVTEDGTPYMVMERLVGRDLDAVMAGPPLELPRVIALASDLLDGLAHAHAAGVVHRDLKPSNVFLTDDGVIKILDFGIAKVFDDAKVDGGETGKLTSTQAVLGSPAYLSPEQLVSSKEVDGRTDIWSVGVILYELSVGETLFGADTVGAIFSNVIKMPIPRVATRRPGIDPSFDRIVMRCLERDANARYQTVVELADDLSDVAGARSSLLPAATGPAAPRSTGTRAGTSDRAASSSRGAPSGRAVASDVAVTALWQRRRPNANRTRILAASLLAGLVAAGLVLWVLARREPERAVTPERPSIESSARVAPEVSAPTRVVTSGPDHAPKVEATASEAPSGAPAVATPGSIRRPPVTPSAAPEDDLWEGSRQ